MQNETESNLVFAPMASSIYPKKNTRISNILRKACVAYYEHIISKVTSTNPKPIPMNSLKPVLVLVVIAIIGISFQNSDEKNTTSNNLLQLPEKDFTPSKRNGKTADASILPEVYNAANWFDLGLPQITDDLVLALKHHKHVLGAGKFKDGRKVGNLNVNTYDFETVIDLLIDRAGTRPDDLHQYLDAHQIWGGDKKGHVRFTGYYTPVVKAKSKKTGKYKYPIYKNPEQWEGPMPTRAEIEQGGHLDGLGLELAYAADPVDISIMQLQGSGYIDYVDTKKRRLFRYAGNNGHKYRNIQRFFSKRRDLKVRDVSFNGIKRFLKNNPSMRDSVLHFNPAYTFFASRKGLVKGAGQVPLLKAISVAADPNFFPPGSVLLASFPVKEGGKVTHHEYRILLPQDVGSAIKGAGRVDVYCGVGESGAKLASNLHDYGKIWMLTPKRNEQVAALF